MELCDQSAVLGPSLKSVPQHRGLGPHIRTEAGQGELPWKTRASHFEQLPFNLGNILFSYEFG